MNEEKLDKLFEGLRGKFDVAEPDAGHRQRFLEKLNASKGVITFPRKANNWWKPLSIAASVALLLAVGTMLLNNRPSMEERLAEISPEVSHSQMYFASLIEEQVRVLESESTPETRKMVDDTLLQLNKLEQDYTGLEQDLLNGGNSKMILSAMITNFQTRIDLLQDVLNQIEQIKNLKPYNDENVTI